MVRTWIQFRILDIILASHLQGNEINIVGCDNLNPGDGGVRNKSVDVIPVNGHKKGKVHVWKYFYSLML